MKLSLSTNWCSRAYDDGAAIAEKALELGFEELELGFSTTVEQVPGYKRMLDKIPVGSIHAFCPVPISAPQGYPELYALASFDKDQRALARFHVTKNIEFAAEMGADTVVLHAGRVGLDTFFPHRKKSEGKIRTRRGAKLLPVFIAELEQLVPILEKHHVTLALENLPYREGFPDEGELPKIVEHFKAAPIRGWFDTGHNRVREMNGWIKGKASERSDEDIASPEARLFAGMHLNDVVDFHDDHFAPGDGKVDFAALKDFAQAMKHVVFEPKSHVDVEHLKKGIALIRDLWGTGCAT